MRRAAAVTGYVAIMVVVALAYETFTGSLTPATSLAIVGFYIATSGIITTFAVWTAGEIGLPSLLILSPLPTRTLWTRWAIYGVGVGLLLCIGNIVLSGGDGVALRPWFWRRIQTPLGTVLFSARAALLEETFFRLFMIPFLVSIVVRTRPRQYRLRLKGGAARAITTQPQPSRWMVSAAVLISSVLFGLAHPFSPVPAMLLAPLLAVSYLRGGWESAVTAHFIANVIVFSVYF